MDAKARLLLSVMILAAGILGLAAGGCSRDPGPEVWVIGLDGADWDQLDPLIARGDLPNLAKLRRDGAAGILRSDLPMISPILWNSIATGKTPDLHGVTWFMTDGPDGAKMPVSSAERRVRTFWNIASEAGLTCGIVGWWATWPADPINGFLVSDFVAWHSFGVTGRRAVDDGKTWPADLVDLVDRIMPSPLDILDGEMRAAIDIVPGNAQFRFILGAIHHRAGRLEQARQAYREAIRLNPELASACYNLGVLENRAGDPAKGHELIERAWELDPTLPMP